MKKLSLFITLTIAYSVARCQLDKGIWLVGGSGSFYHYHQKFNSQLFDSDAEYTEIELSVSIGCFIIDKLAVGLSPSFAYENGNIENQGYSYSPTKYSIAPFARYYFLNKGNQFNILADVRYSLGIIKMPHPPKDKGTINNFTIMAGPEVFFNSSVGMELLMGYSIKKEQLNGGNFYKDFRKGFQASIGFQLHLEKN